MPLLINLKPIPIIYFNPHIAIDYCERSIIRKRTKHHLIILMWWREREREGVAVITTQSTDLVLTSSLLRGNVVAIKINILIVWARPTMKILD